MSAPRVSAIAVAAALLGIPVEQVRQRMGSCPPEINEARKALRKKKKLERQRRKAGQR